MYDCMMIGAPVCNSTRNKKLSECGQNMAFGKEISRNVKWLSYKERFSQKLELVCCITFTHLFKLFNNLLRIVFLSRSGRLRRLKPTGPA